MSYEVLVVIAVINAIATILLWRQVATKASQPLRLNKKAENCLAQRAHRAPARPTKGRSAAAFRDIGPGVL
jgi:hypothetical protein